MGKFFNLVLTIPFFKFDKSHYD